MRSYLMTIEAADRVAARIAEGPDDIATLVMEASAARAAGDTDAADALESAAQRICDAIAGVVHTGLRILAEQQPTTLIGIIEQAADTVDADRKATSG